MCILRQAGEDDFYLGKAAGLEITDNVNDDGTFKDHVPLFAGLAVYNQKGEMDQGILRLSKPLTRPEICSPKDQFAMNIRIAGVRKLR